MSEHDILMKIWWSVWFFGVLDTGLLLWVLVHA